MIGRDEEECSEIFRGGKRSDEWKRRFEGLTKELCGDGLSRESEEGRASTWRPGWVEYIVCLCAVRENRETTVARILGAVKFLLEQG